MDNLIASVRTLMNAAGISNQEKLQIVNTFLEKSIELEKRSIVQSIVNEINQKESKHIELNRIYSTVQTRVGKVAADRFREMPSEIQDLIEKNIKDIPLDEDKLKDILALPDASGSGDGRNEEHNQIHWESECPAISIEEESVKSLKMVRSNNPSDPPVEDPIAKAIRQYQNREEIGFVIEAPKQTGMTGSHMHSDSSLTISDSNLGKSDSTITGTSLELKLHSVQCLRKLHRIRSDRISMRCEVPDDNTCHNQPDEFQLDHRFDLNDIIAFDQPKTLKLFHLDSSFPKTISTYLLLVEKGSPAVGNFISKFYQAVKDDLPDLVMLCAKAANIEISDIGGLFVGKAAGFALDRLIRWLSDSFQDDMFPMKQVFVAFESAPKAQLKSPIRKLNFRFHAAEYEVCCSWAVTVPYSAQLTANIPLDANQRAAAVLLPEGNQVAAYHMQKTDALPEWNQLIVFHINPLMIKSPVPLQNPYIVGRVSSDDHGHAEAKPELRAEVWFGGFSMIEITIPVAAIYEWHEFHSCVVSRMQENDS